MDRHRHRRPPRAAVLALALAGFPMTSARAVADPYDEFRAFAASAFGAEQDPLVYEWFGSQLDEPSDRWEYTSETSAAIAFVTNLPAISQIEYGTSSQYGLQSGPSDGHYSVHLHYLRGLQPGQEYRYRITLTDERGNTHYGQEHTLQTTLVPGAIHLPGGLPGPPYVLDQPGGHYVVDQDFDAPRTAFEVAAHDVALDLGGHRVTYNNEHQDLSGDFQTYIDESGFGVKSIGWDRTFIANGTIRQGIAQNGAGAASIGFNPIYLEAAGDLELAGVTVDYGGPQLVGVFTRYPHGSNEVHHNVFLDRGTVITNRHGTGSRSLRVSDAVTSFYTHHNLVKRTRQSALDGQSIHDNEIYIDSWSTNSYGIDALQSGREAYRNRVHGTGYHVVAFGWGQGNWWHDNFVQLTGQGPDGRSAEYGNQESLNGFRLTQYFGATEDYSDNLVTDNLVLISGGACAADTLCTQARGIQFFSDPFVTRNEIRSNTVKVVMPDEITQAACVVTQGDSVRCGTEAPLLYADNTLISNITNVRIGDYYGVGCNHWFRDNLLVRHGARPDYRTVRFDAEYPTTAHYFFDSGLQGGADLDLVEFTDPGQELTVGWTLTVNVVQDGLPVDAASVEVLSTHGSTVASGTTDVTGTFAAQVPAYVEKVAGRSWQTPTTVRASANAIESYRTVFVDSPRSITVDLGSPTGVHEPATRTGFSLQAHPSVFQNSTEVFWNRPLPSPGWLTVYDLRGRRVRRVRIAETSTRATWNARDERNHRVSSGLYVMRLSSDSLEATVRVMVVR